MADAIPGQSHIFRLGQALLIIFAAIVGASLVVQSVMDTLVGAGLLEPKTVAHQLVRTVVQFTSFVGVVAIYLQTSRDTELLNVARPTPKQALLAVGGVGFLLASQFALLELLAVVGLSPGQNQVITPDHDASYFLGMVVLSLLVVGPVEELLFRGTVQGLLRRAWGGWPAVGIASLLFGLIHYPGITGTVEERLAYVAVAVILGGALGALYERTRNLVVPALAHGGYNAVLFGLQYLDAVGISF